jgi:mannose-6-phosphate isomerase-like protein (cupin superfamily)
MPDDPQAINLLQTFIHLQDGGHARSVTPDRGFWMGTTSKGYDRILGVVSFRNADDLHSDSWEIHREEDELIVVLQGQLEVVLEQQTPPHPSVALHPQQAFIVPAGKWHRLLMREPGVLLFVNSRRHMDHKPVS